MRSFTKQLLFILIIGAVVTAGGLIIYANGNLKINPILGHDLDLNGLYYAQAGNNTVHDITTQDISVSAWVKVDVNAGAMSGMIATKYSNKGYEFYINATDNTLRGYIYDGSLTYNMYSSSAYNDNKWHHVSLVIDRDDAANCKIFVDGSSIAITKQGTITSIGSLTNTFTFNVGARNNGSFLFDGQIRDVKLYYAAGDHWSDAQVLYQAQHPFDYTALAGTLTDYWRLDEGSGTTLYGKVNNLTLSNVLAWTTQPKIKMVKQENTTTTGNNPVGWWKMDEGTASSSYDSSGNGNTGTLTGGVQWATGKLGKGLKFDGVNDYVYQTVSDFRSADSAGTISFWTKGIGTSRFIFSSADEGTLNNYYIGVGVYLNKLFIQQHNNSGAVDLVYGSITINDNAWHHCVVMSNGSVYSMYVDGQEQTLVVSTGANTGDWFADTLNRDNLLIGALKSTTLQLPFSGLIDDVRIYNRALTAGEVAQMYNSTKDGYLGKIKVSTGLVGYWKLDDNNALTSVIDYSGKGNNGTAYSGTATSTSVLSTSSAMVGRAMSFDGVDDFAVIPNPNRVSLTTFNKKSVFMWVKSPSSSSDRMIYYGGYYSDPYGDRINKYDSNFQIYVRNSVGTIAWTSTAFTPDVWIYIGYTWDGTTVRYYKNGIQTDTDLLSGTLSSSVNSFYLGSYIGITQWYNGLLDEVKIWNYARTAEQIHEDYVRGTLHLQN